MKNEDIIQVLEMHLDRVKGLHQYYRERKVFPEESDAMMEGTAREIQALSEAVETFKRLYDDEPLTLDQLRAMVGQPVWIEEPKLNRAQWAILRAAGDTGFFYATLDRELAYAAYSLIGVTWRAYAGVPAFRLVSIVTDRKAWPRCDSCLSCINCRFAMFSAEDWPCGGCEGLNQFRPRAFCSECGRPLTAKAWDMLARRLRGCDNA